jgi:hypothetical protein
LDQSLRLRKKIFGLFLEDRVSMPPPKQKEFFKLDYNKKYSKEELEKCTIPALKDYCDHTGLKSSIRLKEKLVLYIYENTQEVPQKKVVSK